MKTVDELYQQMGDLTVQIRDLDGQAQLLRKQYQRLKREMSEIILAERYGLKLGDVIEVTERRGSRSAKTFRIKLDKFEFDTPKSTYPTVEGVFVKKNGEVGIQRKRLYYFENLEFSKIDEALL